MGLFQGIEKRKRTVCYIIEYLKKKKSCSSCCLLYRKTTSGVGTGVSEDLFRQISDQAVDVAGRRGVVAEFKGAG